MMAKSHFPRDSRDYETSPKPTTTAILAQLHVVQHEKGLNTSSHEAEPKPSENVDFNGGH